MAGELKLDRILELFFRALKGEKLSIRKLAAEYQVSTRSISRDITSLKMFLADHRDSLGNAEFIYDGKDKSYHLEMDEFISNAELLAITKALTGCRPFSTDEMLSLVSKLKLHTSAGDRRKIENLIKKELYNYPEIHFDCDSILENVWEIAGYIEDCRYITITYNKMNRTQVTHRIKPVSIMFSEYYYYLIAYECDDTCSDIPHYFRIDRIIHITANNEHFTITKTPETDEGFLRKRSHFMWPGPLRTIRFAFNGPSLQAVLDRIPTARVIDRTDDSYIIEAETYGDGIKMFLLSQGEWVKVLAPQEFVQEMKETVMKMNERYNE